MVYFSVVRNEGYYERKAQLEATLIQLNWYDLSQANAVDYNLMEELLSLQLIPRFHN